MKTAYALILAILIGGAPLQAQEQDQNQGLSEGLDLLQQGTRLLLEGLLKELGPAMLELKGQVIDLNMYHFPEVLPNGDIIIRRKVVLPDPPDGDIDL